MKGIVPTTPTELTLLGEQWPLERIHEELEQTFDRWLREFNYGDWRLGEFWRPMLTMETGPAIEMEEDAHEVLVTVELPGLEKEDFSVELMDRRLILRGEKKATREEHKKGYRYSASRYGAFTRTLTLPCEVKAEETKADYKNGELRIHLPKTEEAKAKRVEVKVA